MTGDAAKDRGRDRGLALDQEVGITLARLILPRAASPAERGAALNDLGISLTERGERESGTARLEEAVAAYRAALEEWTRARVPLDLARAQMNLGTALQTLGQRESGTARLEEAVAAYCAALEEWTRERVPLDWANCRGNQGWALSILAGRTGDAAMAEAALAQLVEAEAVLREGGHVAWATILANASPAARARLAALGG